MTKQELIERQSWTLNQKVDHTLGAIEEFYNRYEGQVYISFSGGKDSTVLLDIALKLFPEIKIVFVKTGMEFPETLNLVRSTPNVITLTPKHNFKYVVERYGYPVISKKISAGVSRYRGSTDPSYKDLLLHGGINPTSGKKQHPAITKKWHYLIEAPFKISEKCCYHLKKAPLLKFENETGLKPIIGTMAEESTLRLQEYLKYGCNAFTKKKPQSTPMMFWTEEDVWGYVDKYGIPVSEIYNNYKRDGCAGCMFGIDAEDKSRNNRFQKMKITHPKHYNYCINKLELGKVLDHIGIKY
jgi:3'-phosphoadenosine 5'-phosphosulfate sulfotransferase (PAPS reductase)/FAD synthetase